VVLKVVLRVVVMPRADKILNAVKIRNLTKPGRYGDGRGLYLVVAPAGTKKWVLRVVVNRVRRDFGLGSAISVPLAEVRERADEYRRMIRQGLDPKEEKDKRLAASMMPTFRTAALSVHNENKPTWKNAKHGHQWLNTLRDYAFPDLGDMTVDKIDGPAVHGVLLKIWLTKPETARRVRQRIGTVLDWCHAKGYRPHALDMRGLSRGLPKQPKKKEHHAALPYGHVPEFIAALREMDHIGLAVRLFETSGFLPPTPLRMKPALPPGAPRPGGFLWGVGRGVLLRPVRTGVSLLRIDHARRPGGRRPAAKTEPSYGPFFYITASTKRR
jgi:hypothetical protein